ncbi:uncharacterized protein LOC120286970 [Eucalyptus grandis]|uniref:uncharacterized protein LOC120286970 n=1 Tax=Eucalyptus grandis TaxID=71139 RepID=UPI00192EA07C|nr:uncharacterized protein LOC120286970 [Eucalyptus grandis]
MAAAKQKGLAIAALLQILLGKASNVGKWLMNSCRAVDPPHHRLLAVVHALAGYDLRTRRQLFLSPLPPSSPSFVDGVNDVAIDRAGKAYVTNFVANLIWKRQQGLPARHPNQRGEDVQSRHGRLDEGRLLRVDLTVADDAAVRVDGAVALVSTHKKWFLRGEDGWGEAAAYDEVALEVDKFPTSVTLAAEERAYVIHGQARDGIRGNAAGEGREWFEFEFGFGFGLFPVEGASSQLGQVNQFINKLLPRSDSL